MKLFFMLFSFVMINVHAKSALSPNWTIYSEKLNYQLQYRVYYPGVEDESLALPVTYLVDGHWFLKFGDIVKVLDNEIKFGRISPVIVVFVDSRNPENLSENRRNNEFICNDKYVNFFVNELIPTIDSYFSVKPGRENRAIGGLSFGGLNAACFGLIASDFFGGIGMLSPANTEYLNIISKAFRISNEKKLTVFISGGNENDNLPAIKKFKNVLIKKGHDVTFKKSKHGHNWKNWQPLLDDFFVTFFGK